jgi:hypothetical protein
MDKLKVLWYQYGTARNVKVVCVLVTLAALVVAGGAPSTGGGNGLG